MAHDDKILDQRIMSKHSPCLRKLRETVECYASSRIPVGGHQVVSVIDSVDPITTYLSSNNKYSIL